MPTYDLGTSTFQLITHNYVKSNFSTHNWVKSINCTNISSRPKTIKELPLTPLERPCLAKVLFYLSFYPPGCPVWLVFTQLKVLEIQAQWEVNLTKGTSPFCAALENWGAVVIWWHWEVDPINGIFLFCCFRLANSDIIETRPNWARKVREMILFSILCTVYCGRGCVSLESE